MIRSGPARFDSVLNALAVSNQQRATITATTAVSGSASDSFVSEMSAQHYLHQQSRALSAYSLGNAVSSDADAVAQGSSYPRV